jgi:hypothetical protein
MPKLATRQKSIDGARRWLTWRNLVWLWIVAMIVLTIVAMIRASRQPPIHSEPGPPLSRAGREGNKPLPAGTAQWAGLGPRLKRSRGSIS